MSSRLLSLGLPKDILAALSQHGYERLQDLNSVNAESLARDLNISLTSAQELLVRCQNPPTPAATLRATQSAAILSQKLQKLTTKCAVLDKVLDGGLCRGQILEISGPPGSPKEKLAIDIAASFAEAGDEIVFIDCRNTVSPTVLAQTLERVVGTKMDAKRLVHYTRVHTLAELILSMHHLPAFLASHSKVSLLVITSISFPFQQPTLNISQKNSHLEKVKQTLSKVCASHSLTVVTTSQLAVKMVNADGSPGTFDSGGRGTMLPPLGLAYLPAGKAHRVILSLDGLASGFIKLLSSPKFPPGKTPTILEPYSIINDSIV